MQPATDQSLVLNFKNCGSVASASIGLKPQTLNIKYGSNGVGKSTLAKAMMLHIQGEPLQQLLPFRERSKPPESQALPMVTGLDALKTIMIFDEEYVNQFVFNPDELVRNSFDIFVRTPDYDDRVAAIEVRLKTVKKAFQDSAELTQILGDLGELSGSFGKAQGVPKNGKVYKAVGNGNKIDNIPESLKSYTPFLKSSSNVQWIKWQTDGKRYSELAEDQCPFCVGDIADRKHMIQAVGDEYDPNSVGHLVALQAVITRLGEYFVDGTRNKLAEILKSSTAIDSAETNFLKEIRNQVQTLCDNLNQLRMISFSTLREVDDLEEAVRALKIDVSLFSHLKSQKTIDIVDGLNANTDSVLADIGLLQGAVAKHRSAIGNTIEKHSSEINGFLLKAGYPYRVSIIPDGDNYKLRLRHVDHPEHIQGGRENLSFGERNALALVLFMYGCRREKPDLVVLDDPISSFDKHKKYAVIDMLFRGERSLQGLTTLMLTHDVEPVIDAVKLHHDRFQPRPQASFLCARGGVVREDAIKRSDLQTFAQICTANLAGEANRLVKAIYLRRHFEILDEYGLPYQMISSLFKGRAVPTIKSNNSHVDMTAGQIQEAVSKIKTLDSQFDYAKSLADLSDVETLKAAYRQAKAGYDKLQLFRYLVPDPGEHILAKHVNGTYHFENDFIVQLNPRKFDSVPEHLLEACDDLVQKLE